MSRRLIPRRITLALISIVAGTAGAADAPPDPIAQGRAFDAAVKTIYDDARARLRIGDLEGLVRLYREARFAPGTPMMGLVDQQGAVFDALNNLRPQNRDSDLAYENQVELMRDWLKRQPDSVPAMLGLVRSLRGYAWAVRGASYAREVPAASMARFSTLSAEALAVLRQHRTALENDRYGRQLMLDTLRDSGAGAEAVWSVAQGYLRKDPGDHNLYRLLGNIYAPRWLGSADALEYVARESIKLSRAQIGFEGYARIYSSAADTEYGAGLFKDSRARWVDMKQGFEDGLARRPTVWLHHRYAYFACLAGDREALQAQLQKIGNRLDAEQTDWWGGRTGKRTHADCISFAQQT